MWLSIPEANQSSPLWWILQVMGESIEALVRQLVASNLLVDLISQWILGEAEVRLQIHEPSYPVGRTRLEALGVLGCAAVMIMASIEVVQCKNSCFIALFSSHTSLSLYVYLSVSLSLYLSLSVSVCLSLSLLISLSLSRTSSFFLRSLFGFLRAQASVYRWQYNNVLDLSDWDDLQASPLLLLHLRPNEF
jgi:hypothetical protein